MALGKETNLIFVGFQLKTKQVADKGLVEKYKRMVNFKLRNKMRDVKFIMSH